MSNELQIRSELNLSPLLSNQEKNIVLASRAKRIIELNKPDVATVASDLISESNLILGSDKMSSADKTVLIKLLTDLLFEKFQNITIEEFKQAFKSGVLGEFKIKPDEVIYVSVANVNNWVKSFLESKRQAMLKQRQFEASNEKDKTLTDEQKRALEQLFLNRDTVESFKDYKASKKISDPLGAIYSSLERHGFINIPNSRKWKIYEEAEKLIRIEFNDDRNYIKALNIGKDEPKERIRIKARQLSLKEYFDGLIEMEIELEDLIKERFTK